MRELEEIVSQIVRRTIIGIAITAGVAGTSAGIWYANKNYKHNSQTTQSYQTPTTQNTEPDRVLWSPLFK